MGKPVAVPVAVQAEACILIQKQLIAGGMDQAEAENVAAAMVSRVTEEMAKGHLPGLPDFDHSVPVLGQEAPAPAATS